MIARQWLNGALTTAAMIVTLQTCAMAASAYEQWAVLPPLQSDGSAAHIAYCEAGTDTNQARFGGDFVNESKVILKAVRFRFDFYDGFGQLLESDTGDRTGAFPPGTRVSAAATNGWTKGLNWFKNLPDVRSVRCSIQQTLDVQGHIWKNTIAAPQTLSLVPTAPSSDPSSSPSSFPQSDYWRHFGTKHNPLVDGHPKFCTRYGFGGWNTALWNKPYCGVAREEWAKLMNVAPASTTP